MTHLLWFIAGAIVGGAIMCFVLALMRAARDDEQAMADEMAYYTAMKKEQDAMKRDCYRFYVRPGEKTDDKKD